MQVSQALEDIRAFIDSDPLIAAAVNLTVPASTRQVLADHLLAVEADVAKVVQDATAGLEPPAATAALTTFADAAAQDAGAQ